MNADCAFLICENLRNLRTEQCQQNAPSSFATRGSALALAQANQIAAQCRAAFPRLRFELKIIKTTGDKLQKASMAKTRRNAAKGIVHEGT